MVTKKDKKKDEENIVVKCSMPLFIFFEGIAGLLLISYIMLNIQHPHNKSFWQATLLLSIVNVITILWHRTLKIEISNGILIFRSLFKKPKIIAFNNIQKAAIETGYQRPVDKKRPFIRLVIYPKPGIGMNDFAIPMNSFDKNGMRKLLQILPIDEEDLETPFTVIANDKIENDPKLKTNLIVGTIGILLGIIGFFVSMLYFDLFGKRITESNGMHLLISSSFLFFGIGCTYLCFMTVAGKKNTLKYMLRLLFFFGIAALIGIIRRYVHF